MIITLDPGHGKGYNTVKFKSPPYPSPLIFSEGTRNFDYAVMLKKELEAYGFTVFMTREKVTDDPSIRQRAEFAAAHKSDLLLSLHSNAKDDDPLKCGMVCVYSPSQADACRTLAREIADADAMLMKHGVVDVYGDNYFGIVRISAQLGVPRAIIVEHGYHSNYDEAKWLSSGENLKALAKTEARVVYDYMIEQVLRGDVNEDGTVNISDVTALQNILAGIAERTVPADVNRDGKINIMDVTELLNILSGQSKKIMYRVQVGVYTNKDNALAKSSKLLSDGFCTFVEKESDRKYHVYSGSYEVKANAEAEVVKLKKKGYDAFIVRVEVCQANISIKSM